jgi:RNA polymerase sigma factor (sigma-70 family)
MHRTEQTPAAVSPETVKAWDALVRQHSSRIFRLAYRLTGNHADAEDITQEVLVRAMRSPDAGTTGAIEGWLHRVTTNLFVDMVRRRGRARSVSIDDRPWARDPADTGPEPADAALRTALEPDLEVALAELPDAFREAVLLCDVQGLSYAEIGTVVGVKPGTVRSRIHRGRAMLRRALAHRAPVRGRTRHGGPPDQRARREDDPVAVVASGTMSG